MWMTDPSTSGVDAECRSARAEETPGNAEVLVNYLHRNTTHLAIPMNTGQSSAPPWENHGAFFRISNHLLTEREDKSSGGQFANYRAASISKDESMQDQLKTEHEVVGAYWSETSGREKAIIKGLGTVTSSAQQMLMCKVLKSHWKWHDISGPHDFSGTLVHSTN
ncbi:hypothetical protein EDB81DRAFT_768761 [Dactylonectria macrodidyma]|uniref:Uncharacterized protein n=1 Tax=Dactylonectria macrodidyma TaxID=307937 RepID=A0A9P9I8B4_9HYPO|nr:hypothetical protein EDB81DRAFT_768761 [Dactylonectria macrodidyma]